MSTSPCVRATAERATHLSPLLEVSLSMGNLGLYRDDLYRSSFSSQLGSLYQPLMKQMH